MTAPVPPQGVVTFLFTDIEGSTRRWEADAEGMRTALQVHDRVLQEAIEGHQGQLFKHTGDGVCAAFASPSAAVDAGVAAQRVLKLPVRMGIATGEAEHRGSDYFGPVLNRAARVMACGHGGQILLDGQTAGLLSGFDLIGLGARRLRDLAQPVEVSQVQAAGLRSEFPPLRTLDPAPGNLRPQTTSFVGRQTELDDVERALKAHRLVTLTGVGGVGKTRLALEVAARLSNSFSDGVWVVELAAVGDPTAVPDAVAAALGITQQPGLTLTDSVAAALEGRSRLLVFDNCEHVLDAAANLIEAILGRPSTVRILATSREGLRVSDEQLWPVPSLEVRTGADSTAATLFLDRATAVAPGISLTGAEESDAVVEICRRLDGIPLAIELAASRMVSMTAVEVQDRLDDRFRLLVGSRRGLERHQTLRHAVQWSYDLLDDDEKTLLNRCSVFAGGFDLPGACAVTGSTDEFAALDHLDALVRKSLLVADRSSGRTRFSMLETIRQFAEEQLAVAGMGEETRTAHAQFFANREVDVLAQWASPQQRLAYTWFFLELANLRSAFRWAADHDDLDAAAAIASYGAFLGMFVEQYEPVAWAEEVIEPVRAIQHPRLAQLYVFAAQCYTTGRIDDAVRYCDASQRAIASGRFDRVECAAEVSLAAPYITGGGPERVIEWARDMISRMPGADSYARSVLAMALKIAGAADESAEVAEGLLTSVDFPDDPLAIPFALNAFGYAYRDVDPAAALGALRRGAAAARDSGNRSIESQTAVNLSRLAATHGEPGEAFDFITVAIRHYLDSGNFSLLPSPLAILAAFLDRLGHYEAAATISGVAATHFTQTAYHEVTTAIAHLREALGDDRYEILARAGANMSSAAMADYAFGQIDLARAELQ